MTNAYMHTANTYTHVCIDLYVRLYIPIYVHICMYAERDRKRAPEAILAMILMTSTNPQRCRGTPSASWSSNHRRTVGIRSTRPGQVAYDIVESCLGEAPSTSRWDGRKRGGQDRSRVDGVSEGVLDTSRCVCVFIN